MATDWKMVRIREGTRQDLERVRASLRRAAEQGQYDAANRHDVDITLDDVIRELIRRDDAKRERAVKSRQRKGQARIQTEGT